MAPPPLIDVPDNCTSVTPLCPVEGTLYGYFPSLGWNLSFAIFFGLCSLAQLVLGIRYKTWTYMTGVGLGCVCECCGYIGRILMHYNPYSNLGFQIQISLLVFAPAILAAGIYLVLKHVVLQFGKEWSRVKPKWYTYIFIGCDVTSLLVQSAGGTTAAAATKRSVIKLGTDIMIVGIGFQILVFIIFGLVVADYALRTFKNRASFSTSSVFILHTKRFRFFLGALPLAYVRILIRCIYRLPELLGGWGNSIMRTESDFIACEGFMIVLAALALTVAHPGVCFPGMADGGKALRQGVQPKDNNATELRANSIEPS